MSSLNDKLLEIKRQKDTYILPENIRKNVTVYGVTGTLESGSGGIKVFRNVTEMNNSTGNIAGDKALVYDMVHNTPAGESISINFWYLPETIILPATQERAEYNTGAGMLQIAPGEGMAGDIGIWEEYLDGSASGYTLYNRTIQDGQYGGTFTRDSNIPMYWYHPLYADASSTEAEKFNKFFEQVKSVNFTFTGCYYYNGSSWELLPNDMTATTNDISLNKTAYTTNGKLTGTYVKEEYVSLPKTTCPSWEISSNDKLTRSGRLYARIPTNEDITNKYYFSIDNIIYVTEQKPKVEIVSESAEQTLNACLYLRGDNITFTRYTNRTSGLVITTGTLTPTGTNEALFWFNDYMGQEYGPIFATNLQIDWGENIILDEL